MTNQPPTRRVVHCSGCGQGLALPSTATGTVRFRCPKCGTEEAISRDQTAQSTSPSNRTGKKRASPAANLIQTVLVLVALGTIVVGLGAGVLYGIRHFVHSAEHAHDSDVTLGACGVGPFGNAQANVTITNHSSGLSDYSIEVAFYNSAGVHVANGNAFAEQVPAHAVEHVEAATPSVISYQQLTCKVTNVDRTASN